MNENRAIKLAGHALEQAEKHVKLMAASPSQEQFHLDSIMSLLQDVTKTLGGTPLPKGEHAPTTLPDSDPELIWQRERAARRSGR
jgi:hypothetical protein